MKIRLRFSSNRTLGSRLIRAATWSEYSHVEIVMPVCSTLLLGAAIDGGVDLRPPHQDYLRLREFTVEAGYSVIAAAQTQLRKPYDLSGALGLALHRDWQDDDSWFCSELVAWAFQVAGFPLLRADHLHRITPRDLLLSPLLKEE